MKNKRKKLVFHWIVLNGKGKDNINMKTFFDLGKKVRCDSYYKKVRDGIFIACFDKNGYMIDGKNRNEIEKAVAVDSYGWEQELRFEGDGIDKTLYRLVEKEFEGVCVGKITLPVTEYLYADSGFNFSGDDFKYICKQITKTEDCYVVYYANNRKRYVPCYCCKFIED